MQYAIPYGRSRLNIFLPDDLAVDIIRPNQAPPASDPISVVKGALENPEGETRLENFSGACTAAIAVNDKTRPVPHQHLLPPLLESLESIGLKPSNITLFIATGTHPPMEIDEFQEVIPRDILARYPVVSHNAGKEEKLIHLGKTTRGTPITLNEQYYRSDLKIVVGNIEPHQFQGFSGGVKSAVIGLAGRKTINHNHAMMTDPKASLGRYADNPARQDIEEMGKLTDIQFALNAVLNNHKQIVHALAGSPEQVMRAGIPLARDICLVKVSKTYDLVISSPGGHPKDINLYQSQKGLAHTRMITRKNGTILLAAACPEGPGSHSYLKWMKGVGSYQEVFQKFEREGFRVGPHKAFQIARDATWAQLFLYSEIDPGLSKKLLFNPVEDYQETIDQLIAKLDRDAHIAIMPYASSTIPDTTEKD